MEDYQRARPQPRYFARSVVGTGVIGASWAAFFLARGLDVTATDPAPGAEQRLRAKRCSANWPTMQRMGLVDGASPERLALRCRTGACAGRLRFLCRKAAPSAPDFMADLYARMDAATTIPGTAGQQQFWSAGQRYAGPLQDAAAARGSGPSLQSAAPDSRWWRVAAMPPRQ